MTSSTKHTFIIALFVFFGCSAALAVALWQTGIGSARLTEQAALVAQQDERKQAFLQLTRTLEESESERTALEELFLTEDKTIDFLAELEAIAASFGLEMKTTGLDLLPVNEDVFAELNIRMTVIGERATIMQFLELLETLPYHARVESLALAQLNASEWESSLHLIITSLPYDQ